VSGRLTKNKSIAQENVRVLRTQALKKRANDVKRHFASVRLTQNSDFVRWSALDCNTRLTKERVNNAEKHSSPNRPTWGVFVHIDVLANGGPRTDAAKIIRDGWVENHSNPTG
jgi:hypothetical protein